MALESLEIGLYSHRLTNSLLQKLELALRKFEAVDPQELDLQIPIRTFRRLHKRLQRPLRLAIIGELNSGKSSLSNMLIGNVTLPTNTISNTRIATLIRYSATPGIVAIYEGNIRKQVTLAQLKNLDNIAYLDVGLPIKHLRYIELVDFPSLTTMDRENHNMNLTSNHIDAIIWCTSAIGAWKKSEQDAWLDIPDRLKKRAILVVTRKDQLDILSQQKVIKRLEYEVGNIFQAISITSPTLALKAHKTADPGTALNMWNESGGAELERNLHNLLLGICEERAMAAMKVTKRLSGKLYDKMARI